MAAEEQKRSLAELGALLERRRIATDGTIIADLTKQIKKQADIAVKACRLYDEVMFRK